MVLALDTSTPTVTAGVVDVMRPHEIAELMAAGSASEPPRPWRTVAERTVTDSFGHAEHLMPLATGALADAGRAIADLDAVVVGIGPGPFTGLRVGMVTAAALGDARRIPVHGAPSHDAMLLAADGHEAAGDVLVITDARRREVYVSGYGSDGSRRLGPIVTAPAALNDLLAEHGIQPVAMTGAGTSLVADILDLPHLAPTGSCSGALVACALQPLLTGAVPGPLVPLYLRRPDAAEPSAPKAVLPPPTIETRGV